MKPKRGTHLIYRPPGKGGKGLAARSAQEISIRQVRTEAAPKRNGVTVGGTDRSGRKVFKSRERLVHETAPLPRQVKPDEPIEDEDPDIPNDSGQDDSAFSFARPVVEPTTITQRQADQVASGNFQFPARHRQALAAAAKAAAADCQAGAGGSRRKISRSPLRVENVANPVDEQMADVSSSPVPLSLRSGTQTGAGSTRRVAEASVDQPMADDAKVETRTAPLSLRVRNHVGGTRTVSDVTQGDQPMTDANSSPAPFSIRYGPQAAAGGSTGAVEAPGDQPMTDALRSPSPLSLRFGPNSGAAGGSSGVAGASKDQVVTNSNSKTVSSGLNLRFGPRAAAEGSGRVPEAPGDQPMVDANSSTAPSGLRIQLAQPQAAPEGSLGTAEAPAVASSGVGGGDPESPDPDQVWDMRTGNLGTGAEIVSSGGGRGALGVPWWKRVVAQTLFQNQFNFSGSGGGGAGTGGVLAHHRSNRRVSEDASKNLQLYLRIVECGREGIDDWKALPTESDKVESFSDSLKRLADLEEAAKVTLTLKRKQENPLWLSEAAAESVRDELIGQLVGQPNKKVLATVNHIELKVYEIKKFLGDEWLGDESINVYMFLISERSKKAQEGRILIPPGRRVPKTYAMSTFFWPKLSNTAADSNGVPRYDYAAVKKWTTRRKIDIFELDFFVFPVHVSGAHWTLGVIDIPRKIYYVLDSLNPREKANPLFVQFVPQYLADEYRDKKNAELPDAHLWQHKQQPIPPQQSNHNDCGVFTSMFAECIASGCQGFNFSAAEMDRYRLAMARAVLSGSLGFCCDQL
uniref:Ubiquitin-like protease family profile domain-containing protein n=1 Tax=Chromera velia CCMP2878 TaxID=1169474 RepID=A0A0G4I449_9ALVE|eukprot:Cvel_1782.t1-p1 / transcript=Cvel_1782.t1 / gene=Cvel_1782 / organism=Chromera_velia_CCMP2878 / gene_product=Ubiquitin-like-specific protease ESD4, putative / transcript_product=Ubiquitin-like-specific protease ESD4, putative / location=Cvel_scaffold65:90133-96873(-) / protein_length=800 / sequence_SO=supercontig / SO=protein_coding / is_pseudo=false